MKVAVALAVLVAAAALTAVAVAGNPHDERYSPTAADQRLAAGVAFQRAELKGWRYKLATRPPADTEPTCSIYDPDFSRFTVTGFAQTSFTSAGRFVESDVGVFRTSTEAAADFKLSTTSKAWSCTQRTVETLLHNEFKGDTVSRIHWKVDHKRPNMYELGAVFAVKTARGEAALVVDSVLLLSGRGIVGMTVMFPSVKPIPQARDLAVRLGFRAASSL